MIPPSALPPAERAIYSRLRQLLSHPGVLRGNLVTVRRVCGKPTCRCARGPRFRHRSLYLTVSRRGVRRSFYVPADWEARVRTWVEQHGRIRDMVEELSEMYLERLRKRRT